MYTINDVLRQLLSDTIQNKEWFLFTGAYFPK